MTAHFIVEKNKDIQVPFLRSEYMVEIEDEQYHIEVWLLASVLHCLLPIIFNSSWNFVKIVKLSSYSISYLGLSDL